MARFVGIDLGHSAVKVAAIETTLRGPTSCLLEREALPQAETLRERWSLALQALAARGALSGDAVAVAAPGLEVATHVSTFPFSDPRKIAAALPFELEGHIPEPLEEYAYDYQPAPSGNVVIAGIIRRPLLKEFLADLAAVGVDPRIVTHPALAPQNLLSAMSRSLVPADEAVAYVDIGEEQTIVTIARWAKGVDFLRVLPGGGRSLSLALAASFEVPFENAEQWKLQHGTIGEDAIGPDAERGAVALRRSLSRILRELRLTFKAYHGISQRSPRLVLFTGGTSKLRGLTDYFASELQLECRLVAPPSEFLGPSDDSRLEFSQAQSLAMRAQTSRAKRTQRFNFRRGEFAYKSDFAALRTQLPKLLALAGILIVLLLTSGMVRNSILGNREREVDARLCELTQAVLGRCEKNAEAALASLTDSTTAAELALPKQSAATLFAELQARIPQDLDLKIEQASVDMDRISLRCDASSSKDLETFVTSMKTFPCFQRITEGKLEKARTGNRVSFRLEIDVSCPAN